MHRFLTCCAAIGLALLPTRPARACIPIPDASGVTNMEARRAVIWLRQSTFEMIFQNQYSGSAQDFAWVIPLPGVPTDVGQPTDSFLEELDRYTAPMIENQSCTKPCPSWGPPDAGAVPGATVPPPSVTVWGHGSLGDLDYQVLSSTSSQALINWLNAGGFTLPAGIEPLVASYLADGFTFFAAKVASGAASSKTAAVPAVRFTFDRTSTAPVYPLRISAFGRSSLLDQIVWVIADDGTYLPDGYPAEQMSGTEHTETSYEAALDAVMAKDAGRTFAVELAAQGSSDYRREMVYWQYGSSSTTEMQELVTYNGPYIVRLRARLNPSGMTVDLKLKKTAQPLSVEGWYVTPCPGGITQEPCPDQGVVTDDGGAHPTPDAGVPGADGASLPAGPEDEAGGCQLAPSPLLLSSPLWLLLALIPLSRLARRR